MAWLSAVNCQVNSQDHWSFKGFRKKTKSRVSSVGKVLALLVLGLEFYPLELT